MPHTDDEVARLGILSMLVVMLVFVRLCVYMCVRSNISHYNFINCRPIVTKLYANITKAKIHEYW